MVTITTVPLPRAQIAQFITTAPGIKAVENLQTDTNTLGTSITDGAFLMLAADSALGNERVLVLVAGDLSAMDGGAGGSYTLGLATSGVQAGTYGGAAALASVTVDAKGRVTSASQTTISASAPLAWGDGTISLQTSGVQAGTYTNPTSITIDAWGRVTAIS